MQVVSRGPQGMQLHQQQEQQEQVHVTTLKSIHWDHISVTSMQVVSRGPQGMHGRALGPQQQSTMLLFQSPPSCPLICGLSLVGCVKHWYIEVQAAVLREYKKDLHLEQVKLRKPQAGEVLVKVRASGICHSDLTVKNGGLLFPVPVILGHEGAGEVIEVGEGVTMVSVGDHVIVNNIGECGKCRQCHSTTTNLCVETGLLTQKCADIFVGDPSVKLKTPFSTLDDKPLSVLFGPATFATHCLVPQTWVTPFPKSIPFEEAALIGCAVSTGIGCTQFATQVTPGSTCIVFGLGAIGLNIVQGCRLGGASVIIGVDTNPAKEGPGRTFGLTHYINPKDGGPSVEERVKTILDGTVCVDFSFEATGEIEVLHQAAQLVHPFWGVCIAVGIQHRDSKVTLPGPLWAMGRTVKGVYLGNTKPISDGKKILDWYKQHKLEIKPLITHRITLSEINKGIGWLERGEAIRVVINFD